MEGLVAFGLACNVVQTVDFSMKILEIYKERVSERSSTAAAGRSSTSRHRDRLSQTSQELLKELETLDQPRKQGIIPAIRKTAKTIWHSNSIKDLQERLANHKRELDTQILVSQRSNAKRYHDENQEGLETLDEELRYFITRLANGFDKTSDMIQQENEQTRAEIKAAQTHTRTQIQEDVRGLKSSLAERTVAAGSTNTGDITVQHPIEQQRQAFTNSLIFQELKLREMQIAEPHPESCEWLFEEQGDSEGRWSNFVDWLTSPDPVYWIRGKPASGESVTMHFICSQERTKKYLAQGLPPSDPGPLFVTFLFWRAGSPLQRTATGFLQSVIYQILEAEPSIYEHLISIDPNLQNRELRFAWSSKELAVVLDTVLAGIERSVAVFLDGLDEFDEGEDYLLGLIDYFRRRPRVKLCLSSRPTNRLRHYFTGCPQLKLEALNYASINLFVHQKLQDDPGLHLLLAERSKEYQCAQISSIAAEIADKASGVFLWAKLAVQSIREGIENHDSIEILHVRLQELPAELEEMYSHIWQRIMSSRYLQEALLYFRLNFHNVMSLLEVNLATDPAMQGTHTLQAIQYHEGAYSPARSDIESRILSRCAGLLEIVPSNAEDNLISEGGDILFMHTTAYDFMFKKYVKVTRLSDESIDKYFFRLVRLHCKLELIRTEWNPNLAMLAISIWNDAERLQLWSRQSLKRQSVFAVLDVLMNLERAYHCRDYPETNMIVAEDLLGALVELGNLDYVMEKLRDRVQPGPYLNYLLACALRCPDNFKRPEALQTLLAAGAEPQGHFRRLFGDIYDKPSRVGCPFSVYLMQMRDENCRIRKARSVDQASYDDHRNALNLLLEYSEDPGRHFLAPYLLHRNGELSCWMGPHLIAGALADASAVFVVSIRPEHLLQRFREDEVQPGNQHDATAAVEAINPPHVVALRHKSHWFHLVSEELSKQVVRRIDSLEHTQDTGLSDQLVRHQVTELLELTANYCKDATVTVCVKSTAGSRSGTPGLGSRHLWQFLVASGSLTEDPRSIIRDLGVPQYMFGDLGDDPEAAAIVEQGTRKVPEPATGSSDIA